jgi:DNA-binding MarR family transcriptional regulator
MTAKRSAGISLEDYQNLAQFRYMLRRFLRFSEDAAQRAGITPQQHQALLAIKGFPSRERVTVGELAERLQIRHHSAVGLVDRLVAEQLASREDSGADRRCVYVRLTAHGEKILAQLTDAHRRQLRQIGSQLSRLLDVLGRGTPSAKG